MFTTSLGSGFSKAFTARGCALIEKGLCVESEVLISVFFRGQKVGDFRADLVINEKVLLELKTAEKIVRAHEAQVLNYLRSTKLEVGLILNFGPQPQVRRLLLDNSRKHVKATTGRERSPDPQ
jgi:GxxExxY protein